MSNYHGRVVDWREFAEWAHDCGYAQHELNHHDSRCLALVDLFLEEKMEDEENTIGRWVPIGNRPARDGTYKVRDEDGKVSEVRFTNGGWEGGLVTFYAHEWLRLPEHEHKRDVTDLDFTYLADLDFTDPAALKLVSEPELRAMASKPRSAADHEFASVTALAGREIASLEIELFRVFRVAEEANAVVSGKVLSVSENFAAQAVGAGDIVVHEMARLSRALQPGEEITIRYELGMGEVFDGVVEIFDLKVASPEVTPEEAAFIRKQSLEIIGERLQWVGMSESDINDVVIAVCKQAAEKFNWKEIPGSILVSRFDVVQEYQRKALDAAAVRAEALNDINGFDAPGTGAGEPHKAGSGARPR